MTDPKPRTDADFGRTLADFSVPSEPGNERLAMETVAESARALGFSGENLERLKTAVGEAKAGKVEYRVDKAGIVHCRVGLKSFAEKQLSENTMALLKELVAKKPSTAKGIYLRSITLTSTMGPGIRIDSSSLMSDGEEES